MLTCAHLLIVIIVETLPGKRISPILIKAPQTTASKYSKVENATSIKSIFCKKYTKPVYVCIQDTCPSKEEKLGWLENIGYKVLNVTEFVFLSPFISHFSVLLGMHFCFVS